MAIREVRRSRLLDQGEYHGGSTDRSIRRLDVDITSEDLRGYRPEFKGAVVKENLASVNFNHLRIEPSRELDKLGYYIPDFARGDVLESKTSWEMYAHVEMNEEGVTEYVFLLSPAADKDINAKVERMLYQGALFTVGEKCSGRVVINFKGEK